MCEGDLKPTEIACCAECVSGTRWDLATIQVCYALLPAMLGAPQGASLGAVMGGKGDAAALPGGDVLVMLGPGGGAGAGEPGDPPAVAHEMSTWCEAWAELRGERTWPRVGVWHGRWVEPSVESCTRWLHTRLEWAMQHHPAASEFAEDMGRIRVRLENATHSGTQPETGTTCPRCGGTVERRWTSRGKDDDWSCPGCGSVYTPAELDWAVRVAIEQTG